MSEELIYKTSKHIVAFIDILGASEMIKKDEDATLNKIHLIYDQALKFCEKMCEGHPASLDVKIFSDNIIISCEVKDGYPLEFQFITYFSAYLQLFFAANGILVRGAITKGNFYFDGTMVWGGALLEAVNIEKNAAIYPRIILDSNEFFMLVDVRGFKYTEYYKKDF